MTARQINLVLGCATAAVSVGAVASVGLGLFMPLVSSGADSGSSLAAAVGPRSAAPTTLPSLAAFEPLFERRLRTPLEDAPAPSTPEPAAAQPEAGTPPLVLVGTVGDSLAMLRMMDGSVTLAAVGDEIVGMKLLAIHPTRVELRSGGRTVILEKSADPAPATDTPDPVAPMPPAVNNPTRVRRNVGVGY